MKASIMAWLVFYQSTSGDLTRKMMLPRAVKQMQSGSALHEWDGRIVSRARKSQRSHPCVVLSTYNLASDRTRWYKKPDLRSLYFILFPACMGIQITSGFDSQSINTVQIVYTWNKCAFSI